ncbi:unnamed protein product [Caenorhabditis bovis]|uniref:Tubulin--tyrosine ligase-like protein 12 SET-like domain-containing protein n=1 Tax=Caenorhabditis bovis TaxID=2654633 RepID=A0A8S1EXX3_9PELO|nr:unnamed protein product [Caenorhabditis bovis]
MTDARESPEYPFSKFLDQHTSQLEASSVPPELWFNLYVKLVNQRFDAGDYFKIICEIPDDGEKNMSVLAINDMHNVDEHNVFLIDHLLTFESENLRKIIESSGDLLKRLVDLFGLDNLENNEEDEVEKIETSNDKENQKYEQQQLNSGSSLPRPESVDARLGAYSEDSENNLVDAVIKEVWKNAQTYTVCYKTETGMQSKPMWYLMDEFGSRIRHSSNGNVRTIPLMFLPQSCAYNIMFLTRPIAKDEEVTRDFAQNIFTAKNPEWRKYLELPWVPNDFSNESSEFPTPTEEYFTSGRNPDHLASSNDQETANSALSASLSILKSRKLRIYADDTQLIEHLKRDYELVDDWKKADIVWCMKHFHDFKTLCEENPCGMINQFPYESCLTVKDLLATCAMHDYKKNKWYQLTYNLNTELPQFVACYQKRQKDNIPNVWIVKPWNLARGMEMCVTDDLNKIIRLVETGPKVVCEYITRPLLFPRPDNGNRVKFDLRYIVFVNSFEPITAYIYNKFWIRFAINEFVLGNFDDLETHFTVFNYSEDPSKVLNMKCEKFIETIEKEYPKIKWSELQTKINSTIHKALEAASKNKPPRGVASNVQSRAMYGVDIMLQYDDEANIKPTLLEVNFTPDCTRACQYYPDFADTVFETMFLGEINPANVTPI